LGQTLCGFTFVGYTYSLYLYISSVVELVFGARLGR
jgi:hypothetical protein